MSKTVTFQQRIQQLRELEADLPEILRRAAEEATKKGCAGRSSRYAPRKRGAGEARLTAARTPSQAS